MAAGRQQQFPGQMRVDAPHLRAIESGVAADFDVLVGQMLAGGRPLVVSGFELSAQLTAQATSASLVVAGSQIAHPLATDAGSILRVPATRSAEQLNPSINARISGAWTTGVNYVGIDLRRTADSSTADVVQFIDADTKEENPQSIPLARTFDYTIYISTQDFSTTPTIAPLCKVTLDASLAITAVEDARNLFFRLGSGGSITNYQNTYSFPGGRTEPNGGSANSTFHVGDKAIGSLKDWANAIMTRLWEVGGGEYWYSPTATHNVNLVRTGSPFVSNGQYYEWDGTNLHWQGLRLLFDNSTGYYNVITDQTTDSAGLTDLADGQCIYVDAVRTSNATVTAQKGTLATLGSPLTPGSRFVIAWRVGSQIFTRNSDFFVGAGFAVATTSAVGTVKLSRTSGTPSTPVVLVIEERNAANGVLGLDGNLATTVTAAASSNATAVTATGDGTGAGVSANGGATGHGLVATSGATGGNGVVASAQSGSGGIGLQAQGDGAGTGVDLTGGQTGSGIIVRSGVGTNNVIIPPLVQNLSRAMQWSYIDWLGLPGGRLGTINESWAGIPAQELAPGSPVTRDFGTIWNWDGEDIGGNQAQTNAIGPSLLSQANCWQNSNTTTSTGSYLNVYTKNKFYQYNDWTVFVAEFEMAFTTGVSDVFIGLSGTKHTTAIPASTDKVLGLACRVGDTTWHIAYNNGTSVQYQDTSIAVTNGTVLPFRLEIIGGQTIFGASMTINLRVGYVNTYHYQPFNVPPTGTNMMWEHYERQTGNNLRLTMGGLHLAWGRVRGTTTPY